MVELADTLDLGSKDTRYREGSSPSIRINYAVTYCMRDRAVGSSLDS